MSLVKPKPGIYGSQAAPAPRLPSLDNTGSSLHWPASSSEDQEQRISSRSQQTPTAVHLSFEGDNLKPNSQDITLTPRKFPLSIDSQISPARTASCSKDLSWYLLWNTAHSGSQKEVATLADKSGHNDSLRYDQPASRLSPPESVSPHSSIHLYDMRISQHLRSLSSYSKSSATRSLPGSCHQRIISIESEYSDRPKDQRLDRALDLKSTRIPSFCASVMPLDGDSLPASKFDSKLPSNSTSVAIADSRGSPRRPGSGQTKYTSNDAREMICWLSQAEPYGTEAFEEQPVLDVSSDEKLPKSLRTALNCSISENNEAKYKPKGKPVRLRKNGLKSFVRSKTHKTPCKFDGPNEDQAEPIGATLARSSRGSVSGNFDEAGYMWEKAWNSQQSPSIRRRSRVFSKSSVSLGRSNQLSSAVAADNKDEKQPPRHGANSISFKPIDTPHTFDRLSLPGATSLGQPPWSPPSNDDRIESKSPTTSDQERSHSQPPPTKLGLEERRSSPVRLFSRSEDQSRRPGVSVTDTQPANSPTDSDKGQDLGRSSGSRSFDDAWSRYPSHNRNERSLSAGIADSVFTRDFAPLSSASGADEVNQSPEAIIQKLKRRKALSKALRKFFLKDLSARVKPFTSGFRKGESGHRSSIAVSGTLEYPELELLPLGEPDTPSHPDEVSEKQRLASERKRSTSTSLAVADSSPQRKSEPSPHSSTIKSRPGQPRGGEGDQADQREPRVPSPQYLSAPNWSHEYQASVVDPSKIRRRNTEDISPLDGTCNGHAGTSHLLRKTRHSYPAASLSLPSATWSCSHIGRKMERPDLGKSFSTEELRDSTHELWRTLDDAEEDAVAKVIATAEKVWHD